MHSIFNFNCKVLALGQKIMWKVSHPSGEEKYCLLITGPINHSRLTEELTEREGGVEGEHIHSERVNVTPGVCPSPRKVYKPLHLSSSSVHC